MAAHRRCNGCHRAQNPPYTGIKRFSRCGDCHRPFQEGYYLADPDQALFVSVGTGGLLEEGDALESYFIEEYEDLDFVLEGKDEADLKVHADFQVVEVFDKLLPAGRELKLYKGTCLLTILFEKEEILRITIHSKTISSRKAEAAIKEIVHYLKEEALIASLSAFSKSFDGV